MSTVAIKSIAILPADTANTPAAEQFSAFDQAEATLSETGEDEATGTAYRQEITFVVRREADIATATKYQRRAVALQVHTVDGHHYNIGSLLDPVYLNTNNRYEGTKVREMQVTASTQSLFPIL